MAHPSGNRKCRSPASITPSGFTTMCAWMSGCYTAWTAPGLAVRAVLPAAAFLPATAAWSHPLPRKDCPAYVTTGSTRSANRMPAFLHDCQHWVFDMDGTLTRAVHDFGYIRHQLKIPPEADILGDLDSL